MALPGSKLYKDAIMNGTKLPTTYEGFSFHSYDTEPLPTIHLTPAEILEFRDNAFNLYHSNLNFLNRVKSKFGQIAVDNINEMLKVKLKRKILEKQ